ncbi:MAG: arylsulfatase [Cytophagales bacterium]|nr:arylsulfatase [Cytophagales bacterium]
MTSILNFLFKKNRVTIWVMVVVVMIMSFYEKIQTERSSRPNIILILADDLGYGDLGCYGQQRIQTPNIDRMAREGMRFTQHYAGSAVCAPSRSVLMTGLHTGHTPVRSNGADKNVLPDSVVTIAEMLQEQGYVTAMIGKWGLGEVGTPGEPLNQGFDQYYGYLNQIRAHNYYPSYLIRNGEKEMLRNEAVYMDTSHWSRGLGSYSTEKVDYTHDLFTQEALAFIEKDRDPPFFLYLPYTIPHNNGEAPKGEQWEVPDHGSYTDSAWTREQRSYAAMISRMDHDIGRIIEKLRASNMDKKTLVLFTSDNGPVLHTVGEHFKSSGKLKGGKRDLYEGGIRVPFIAYWPGQVPAGTVSNFISAFWDIFPTLGELAGLQDLTGHNGISLVPTLLEQKSQQPRDYLYWEFAAQGGKIAIRKGDWKAVKNDYVYAPSAPFELYNLSQDPGEETDLAAQYPGLLREMEAIFLEAHTPSLVFPLTSAERALAKETSP